MSGCLCILTVLEQAHITRKILEDTRLGKYVNDIRRKSNEKDLSKRLKNLVKKWRITCQAEPVNGDPPKGPGPGGGTDSTTFSQHNNVPSIITGKYKHVSPLKSLPSSGHTSPDRASAPTSPSVLLQKTQKVSPSLVTSESALNSKSKYLNSAVSPILAAKINPQESPPKFTKSNLSPLKVRSQPVSPRLISKIVKSSSISPVKIRSQPVSPEIVHDYTSSVINKSGKNYPYTPSVENVPKTNAANKRLRKEDENYNCISKRPRMMNGFDEELSRDSLLSVHSQDRASKNSGDGDAEIVEIVAENVKTLEAQKPRRKCGRKKKNAQEPQSGSKSSLDPLRQQMAAVNAQSAKVKTTSQLVAELAQRKGDETLAKRATNLESQVKSAEKGVESENQKTELEPNNFMKKRDRDNFMKKRDRESIKLNKKEHIEKFLKSQQPGSPVEDEIIILDSEQSDLSSARSSSNPSPIVIREIIPYTPIQNPNSPVSNIDLLGIKVSDSAEIILSHLPPINSPTELEAESCPSPSKKLTHDSEDAEELSKLCDLVESQTIADLHTKNFDSVNGTFDGDGRFREWHEVYQTKSYQDTSIVVLPYVVTDF